MNRMTKTVVAALALATLATGASAKDWIEKVELKRDGIDHAPIEVSANKGKYTGIATGNHRFLFSIFAKAKSGKRIAAMKIGTVSPVRFFESDGGAWNRTIPFRDLGSGKKRTVSVRFTPVVPVFQIQWQGNDPREACHQNLLKEIGKGKSKDQILNREWIVTAKAHFAVNVVAARKGAAKKGKLKIGNTTDETDSHFYPVRVKCRKGL